MVGPAMLIIFIVGPAMLITFIVGPAMLLTVHHSLNLNQSRFETTKKKNHSVMGYILMRYIY